LFEKVESMDHHPKSIKKAIRYIKQDATKEQLLEIKKLVDYAIRKRTLVLGIDNRKAMG
jgi:hypothetical protein